jgi:uncharacterized Tic20 family protein
VTDTPPADRPEDRPEDRPQPPPYQGVYGMPPGQQQPAFQPADPAYGRPQYGPPQQPAAPYDQAYDPRWGYGPPGVPQLQQYGEYGVPQGDMTTALWCYVGALLGGFLVPLILYFVKKNDSTFVRFHAAQSLNFALTQMIVAFGYIVPIVIIAIATDTPAVLALILPAYLYLLVSPWVWMIMGAIKSGRGEWWRMPKWACFRMVR